MYSAIFEYSTIKRSYVYEVLPKGSNWIKQIWNRDDRDKSNRYAMS